MLSDADRYLFDTLGFITIPDVLSPEELSLVNRGVDRHFETDFHQRTDSLRNSKKGTSGRFDCGNFLSWPDSDGGDVFRSILNHHKLGPVISEFCGRGYRLDHKPVLFVQRPGGEGFDLHGGAICPDGEYNYPISYHCHANRVVCNLINVAVQLTDSPAGSGGFVVIPGSHKSNFPYPNSPQLLEKISDQFGYQPVCKAGDAILFTEACLHGAAVRNSINERRVALIRFSPPTCAYARGYVAGHEFEPLLDPAQRTVIEKPYHLDQDRPVPETYGGRESMVPRARRSDKKEFDRVVFNHDYY
jgi:hypothetical protein